MMRRFHSCERGDVLFAAVMFLMATIFGMGLVLYVGRIAILETELQSAVTNAARQATLHQSVEEAENAANEVIDGTVNEWLNTKCLNQQVTIEVPANPDNLDEVARGEWVAVRASCVVKVADLYSFLRSLRDTDGGLTTTVSAVSRERVDVFRGEQ